MLKLTTLLAFAVTVVPLICFFEGVDAEGDGSLNDQGAASGTDEGTIDREEESMNYGGFSTREKQMMEASTEKHEFQAEVGRLMGLIINSLYSNKEIFLRELISNASDALDKIRYQSLTDPSLLGEGDQANLEIRIKANPETNSLSISDSGVGMTRNDLVNHLGSIASSGTKKFVESVMNGGSDSDTSNLIGQFGVGFYSVFLVADEVTVTSKNNEDDQHIWISDADSSYTLVKDPRGNTLGRGTKLDLKLKEDALEFLDEDTLKGLVGKYSEFINFPIYLWTTSSEEVEVDLTEEEIAELEAERAAEKEDETDDEDDESDEDGVEEVEDEEEEPIPTTKKVKKDTSDWVVINSTKPIWTRSKDDIEESEYNDFFKALTKGTDDPMTHIHFAAEGEVDFRSILYIPDKAPSDLFTNYGQKGHNIKLYVRRVFITDDFDDILPKYLAFIKGMVDSDNLPLNVSREMLQQHKMLKTIKKKLTRKALEMVKRLTNDEDEEAYEKFWKEFGTSIKLGLIEDTANRTKIAKLLRFKSSKSGEKHTSLEEYVERMKDNQQNIYYLAGENLEKVQDSPYLEVLLKRGFECLYLVDPVDEYTINSLPEFDGKKLMNVGKEDLKFGDEDEDEDDEDLEAEYSDLLVWLKTNLPEKIEKAVLSKRLYTSPCALVTGYFGYTPNMERIVKAQTLSNSDSSSAYMMNSKRNMEINPRHPLIKELNRRVLEDEEDPTIKELANLLYDTAALSSGYNVGDTKYFSEAIHKFMMKGLDLDPETDIERDEELEAMEEEAKAAEAAAAEAEDEGEEVDAEGDEDKDEL